MKTETMVSSDDATPRDGDRVLLGVLDVLHTQDREGEISLTIHVGGTVISGTAISQNAYMDRLENGIKEAFGRIGVDTSKWEPVQIEGDSPATIDLDGRAYVHLRDVTFFDGESKIHFRQWRVRADHISGFDFASYVEE